MRHRMARGGVLRPAVALLVWLGGCTPPARPADTAVVASGADLEDVAPLLAVHPLTRQVHRHVWYLTLVQLDSTLAPAPRLATAWVWSDDRRTLQVTLAPDVRWHDGVPTTAEDVVFTLDAARNPAIGSPRAAELAMLTSVVAIDAHTVQLRFAAPMTTLPTVLAELPIMPRHRWAAVPAAAWRTTSASRQSVGNGPFRLERRIAGESWVFARQPDFPATLGGPAVLSHLVVQVVDEPATKLAGLVSGSLDMAGVSPAMASIVSADPTLRLVSPPVLFSTVLVCHVGRPPFDDPRVRRAVSRALHRARLVAVALNGFGVPAGSAVPPGVVPGAPPSPREDVQEANALLDAAGWRRGPDGVRTREGRRFEVELWTVGSGDLAIEQLVQADLAAVGVAVRIRAQEFTSLLAALRAPLAERRFDLALTGIPGDVALGHLEALLHSRAAGGALALAGAYDAALDTAIDRARARPVASAAAEWAAVDARLDAQMPLIWLYHAKGVQGLSRRLSQVTIDLRGELATVAQWRRTAR